MVDYKIITILDGITFSKKMRALKKYFPLTYKYLIFEFFPKLKSENKKDGLYSHELPTDYIFKTVHGNIVIKFKIKNNLVILEDILPSEIMIEMYTRPLPFYKGVPYRNEKEYFKIKLLCNI